MLNNGTEVTNTLSSVRGPVFRFNFKDKRVIDDTVHDGRMSIKAMFWPIAPIGHYRRSMTLLQSFAFLQQYRLRQLSSIKDKTSSTANDSSKNTHRLYNYTARLYRNNSLRSWTASALVRVRGMVTPTSCFIFRKGAAERNAILRQDNVDDV